MATSTSNVHPPQPGPRWLKHGAAVIKTINPRTKLFYRKVREDAALPIPDCRELVAALVEVRKKIVIILGELEEKFASWSAHEFSVRGTMDRLEAINSYRDCFTSLSLFGRWELFEVVQKFSDNSAVQEAYRELEDIEETWSKFVERFEEKMAKEKPAFANEPLKVGDGLHEELLNYEFKDIKLEKMISLKDILSQSKNTLFILLRRVG